jgi:hypothetical protein
MCARCPGSDEGLCPACVARGDKAPERSGDALGWLLLGIPVAGGVAVALSPEGVSMLFSIAVVAVTAVIAGIDARRSGESAGGAIGLLALLWIVGYPLHFHRRAKWGRPQRLPLAFVAMVLFLGGAFARPFLFQDRAKVLCNYAGEHLSDGFLCAVDRTSGVQDVEVCWDLVIDCGAGSLSAHRCEPAAAGSHGQVKLPFSAFSSKGSCAKVESTRLEHLTVTVAE